MSRYYDSSHSGEEIKPGKISAELREALNLPENDLPIWIYRMRALGYPPGWLKQAIVDTNDIFDTDTDHEAPGSKKRKSPSNDQIQYDHSKLIEYPGFNAPMPKNCVDYHYYVNMPAMLEHQQLEYAKKHMNAFKPAHIPKRIRTSMTANTSAQSSLDESNDTTTGISTTQADTEGSDKSPDRNDSTDSGETKPSSSSRTKDGKSSLNTTTNSSFSEEFKLLSKGSPMPKPVARAPLEKFSEGVVGELLYFENIPNSTGKFDSIRGLLNTIRKSRSENDTSFGSTKSLD